LIKHHLDEEYAAQAPRAAEASQAAHQLGVIRATVQRRTIT
jgi:hypothetical protein